MRRTLLRRSEPARRPLRVAGIVLAAVAALGLAVIVLARLLWFDGTEEAPPFTLPPPASVAP